jgi:hypothetical protein
VDDDSIMMTIVAVMVSCGVGSHDRLRGAAVTIVVVDTSSFCCSRKKRGFRPVEFCCFALLSALRFKEAVLRTSIPY